MIYCNVVSIDNTQLFARKIAMLHNT